MVDDGISSTRNEASVFPLLVGVADGEYADCVGGDDVGDGVSNEGALRGLGIEPAEGVPHEVRRRLEQARVRIVSGDDVMHGQGVGVEEGTDCCLGVVADDRDGVPGRRESGQGFGEAWCLRRGGDRLDFEFSEPLLGDVDEAGRGGRDVADDRERVVGFRQIGRQDDAVILEGCRERPRDSPGPHSPKH
nr:hypothetical protein [Pseudonocardia sp.]